MWSIKKEFWKFDIDRRLQNLDKSIMAYPSQLMIVIVMCRGSCTFKVAWEGGKIEGKWFLESIFLGQAPKCKSSFRACLQMPVVRCKTVLSFFRIYNAWLNFSRKYSFTQCPEINFNKTSNNIHKTYMGLTSMLQGFQKCIAWNPSK